MLTVERMVVFEHKHRESRRWLVLRLDKHRYVGLPGSNLSAAHGMSRVHRIARKDRDVIMFGRIQNDLTGIHRRLCGAGPAGAIANIAHGRRTEHSLAAFAGNRPHAALRHDWHVAGVEVRSIDGWG